MLITVAVVAVVVVAGLVLSLITPDHDEGSSSGNSGGATAPSTEVSDAAAVWTFDLASASSVADDAHFTYNPDEAFTGPQVIGGDNAWVLAWTANDQREPEGLVAVDPATGASLWDRALPSVRCADQQVSEALLCVAREGETWQYHRIDATTGVDLATAPLSLDAVQTVHARGEVLIAVGPAHPAPHADVAGIALDGTELWRYDIATIDGADLLFSTFYDSDGKPVLERPRWRNLDDGLVMLWSTPGVAIIDPATGDTFVHECRSATPAGDHYFCSVDEDLHRYELDGTMTWSTPNLRPATPEDASDVRLVALAEPDPNVFDVRQVDEETGTVGDLIYSFVQSPGGFTNIVLPPSINTEPDVTFLVGDEMLVALDPSGALLWSTPHEYIYVGDMYQDGDTALLDNGDVVGLDLATGEVLWERNVRGELARVANSFVAISLDEITLLDLP